MFKGVDHGSDTYRDCWEGDEYQEEYTAWLKRCIKRSQDYVREQRETARLKQLRVDDLTLEEQRMLILQTGCDIRNAINLLFEVIPSLEFSPYNKAVDHVFKACELLEDAYEQHTI